MVLKTSHLMQTSTAYIFSKKLYSNFYEKNKKSLFFKTLHIF